MGFFDLFNGKKKERERQEQLMREQAAAEARRKEEQRKLAERQRIEAERKRKEGATSMTPFVFHSNCHQRYQDGKPVMGLQECKRTVRIDKNTSGCPGYRLEPGKGYIVKVFNDDLGKPNMSDKPMVVVRKTENSVELRGFPIEAQTPFGWQEVDYRDYGMLVHYEHGKVSKCVLHMYDRNTFIEYRVQDNSPLEKPVSSATSSEAEAYAKKAMDAAQQGNTSRAHQYGIEVFRSLCNTPSQLTSVKDVEAVALSLGKLMECDYFRDNATIMKAVAFTYYFLSKAIAMGKNNPYLYVYRFSVVYEYNTVFYHLFAHSEGTVLNSSPFDVFGQSAMMAYDHHLQGMQMADGLTEPRVAQLDPALGNIFAQVYGRYRTTPRQQIITLGNKYHQQIFSYLADKIAANDLEF